VIFAVLVLRLCCCRPYKMFFINICCFGACMGPVWAFSRCVSSVLELQNIIQIVYTQQSYDVTLIFQDGGRDVAILLLISFLMTSLN